jgi:hypothetical protein
MPTNWKLILEHSSDGRRVNRLGFRGSGPVMALFGKQQQQQQQPCEAVVLLLCIVWTI